MYLNNKALKLIKNYMKKVARVLISFMIYLYSVKGLSLEFFSFFEMIFFSLIIKK